MSREQIITMKEVAMLLFGVLLSVLGAFQAYVIKDMSDDMKDLKSSIIINEERSIAKFDNIEEKYVLKERYASDQRKLNDDVRYLKQFYFRREDDQ